MLVYKTNIPRSAGSKELTTVSAKLGEEILRKHFGYTDDDIVDYITKHSEKFLIFATSDANKITTDYEWEQIIAKTGTKITITLTDKQVSDLEEFLKRRRLTFIEIEEFPGSPIGQIGFLDNKAVIIVAYYDDYDTDKNGKVSWGEWITSFTDQTGLFDNEQFTKVAMTARLDSRVLSIDDGFYQKANNIYLSFAGGMIISGMYEVYLSQAVASAASLVGKRIIGNSLTRRFLVEKGAEKIVEKALNAAYQNQGDGVKKSI